MEARRRRRPSSAAVARRLHRVLALAGDYLKYLFMRRRRLLGKVARRTLALINHPIPGRSSGKHLTPSTWPLVLMEHEFSCSSSPGPALAAVKRLRSRLRRGAGAAAGAAVSASSCFGAIRTSSYRSSASPPAAAGERAEHDEEEEDAEEEEEEGEVEELDVDYRAEEFINMFYEQLRAQSFSFPAFLQCSP